MDRIVIIDGNSLINRAYYAMQRPMITKEGIYTQGIYGFLNMLSRIKEDYSPEYIAVAWDRKSPTFRHKEYKEYKAGRKKMPPELAMELPIIKEILDAMKISNLEIDGFEADDIIGTISRIAEGKGISPLIITGDKDALQLSGKITKVLITKRGITDFEIYDYDKMLERYELTPQQFIDLKGLMGDFSDNIPGIPGVGEKTGIKLLKQFGSVENLLKNTEEIKNEKLRNKVEENAQLAAMSRSLAEINRFVPLDIDFEDFRCEEPDLDKIIELYTKLEFNSFLKKMSNRNPDSKVNSLTEDTTKYEKIIIKNEEDLEKLEVVSNEEEIIIKTFGNNDHVGIPLVEGMSVISGELYFYIDFDEIKPDLITEIFNKKNVRFIGHELIADYYMLGFYGLTNYCTEFDTSIAAYVLEPSKSNYDIKTLAFETLHTEIESEQDFRKNRGQMDLLGENKMAFAEYGFNWCRCIKLLHTAFLRKLEIEGELKICTDIEFPLIEVLADMQRCGIETDKTVLEELGNSLQLQILDLEKEIHELAGEKFNVNSPAQLGPILFEKLELPMAKKTKRGYSTSADILEKIRDKHPIIPLILQFRTLSKLNSTYIEGLKPLIGFDGKIRAHFQQLVAATGRLSCTEPNLQNIPVRYEIGRKIRKAFVSEDGFKFVGADYSQIELRILAHLSGDENMVNAFNARQDIHRITASRVFNIPADEVTPLDRSRAKAVNFGVIYGMSGFGLSEELNITVKDATKYIEDYFEKHEAVKKYLESQIKSCREKGYSETLFGRKRYIPEIKASNYMTRQFGERLAMNSPIQGTAADIIKIAMNKVYTALKKEYPESKLILQVHDELIISARDKDVEGIKELLISNMENAAKLAVELTCDMNCGSSWYELKD